MTDRVYTRIDAVRRLLDDMLKACTDKEVSRSGYVHLYGVGQACALLALRRGHDRAYAELAEIAGMLHDYTKYLDGEEAGHAQKSSLEAERVMEMTNAFSRQEIDMVCTAIRRHSNKAQIDGEMDEILKDADELQHWLRNPLEDYFFEKARIPKLIEELELGHPL